MGNSMLFPADQKNNTHSPGMTAEIFVVIIIYIGFFSVTRVVGIEEIAADALATKGIRVASILIAFLASGTILLLRKSLSPIKSPLILALAFYFLACLLSVPNSLFPSLSFIKSIEIFQAVLLCLIGVTTKRTMPYHFFGVHGKILLFIAFLIVIESLTFPSLAWHAVPGNTPFQEYMLRGVYPAFNPNTVGLIGGLLATIHFPKIFLSNNSIHKFLFLFGIIVVVLSYSRSSLVAVLVALMFTLHLLKKTRLIFLSIIFIGVLLILNPSIVDGIYNHLIRGQDVESLTAIVADRPTIWRYIWTLNHLSLFGLGLGAAFRHHVLSLTGWGHAHNTFFQLLADLGWVGVVAWINVILLTIKNILFILRKRIYSSQAEIYSIIAVFTFLLAKSYGHSTLYIFNPDFIVFVSIVIYIEKTKNSYILKRVGTHG